MSLCGNLSIGWDGFISINYKVMVVGGQNRGKNEHNPPVDRSKVFSRLPSDTGIRDLCKNTPNRGPIHTPFNLGHGRPNIAMILCELGTIRALRDL